MRNIPYGYIYETTNLINGKTYIGQHIHRNEPWRQYLGSGMLLVAAIRKYGKENFTKRLIRYAWSPKELNMFEVVEMRKAKEFGKAEYNIHVGSPAPPFFNPYQRLKGEALIEMKKKGGEARKRYSEQKYYAAIKDKKSRIIDLYEEECNIRKVAEKLSLSRNYVSRFLKEENIALNHQNVAGKPISESKKKSISAGVKKSNKEKGIINTQVNEECEYCGLLFQKISRSRQKFCSTQCSTLSRTVENVKKLPDKEVLEQWYLNGDSFSVIAKKLGLSRGQVSTIFSRYNIKRRPSPNPSGR